MSSTKKVRIFTPHTHNGKRYTPDASGEQLDVNEADAKFLEGIGATKAPAPKQDAAPTNGRTGV